MAGSTFPLLDPICGMKLLPDQVAATQTFYGRVYAFCCIECRDIFARAPERHIVSLAHDPERHAGHQCPTRRSRSRTQDGPEPEPPDY